MSVTFMSKLVLTHNRICTNTNKGGASTFFLLKKIKMCTLHIHIYSTYAKKY